MILLQVTVKNVWDVFLRHSEQLQQLVRSELCRMCYTYFYWFIQLQLYYPILQAAVLVGQHWLKSVVGNCQCSPCRRSDVAKLLFVCCDRRSKHDRVGPHGICKPMYFWNLHSTVNQKTNISIFLKVCMHPPFTVEFENLHYGLWLTVILFNSTLTMWWWVISPFYDFCCFRCVTHCMSPLTSV